MKVLSGGRDEHVEGWRGGWKRTSLRRSEKAREGAQAVDQAKNEINMHRLFVCINFWRPSQPFTPPFISPFTPPSLRPRSPLTEKATKSMHFYIA